jgi:hypothetical protein
LILYFQGAYLMNDDLLNQFGGWLHANNLTVFVFPDIDTGEIFWLTQQPSDEPIARAATLAEAVRLAGDKVTL